MPWRATDVTSPRNPLGDNYSTVPSGLSGLAWSGGSAVPLERPPGMRWALPLDVTDAGVLVEYVSDGESRTSTPGFWTLPGDSTAGDTIAVTPVEGLPNEAVTLTASVRSAAGMPAPDLHYNRRKTESNWIISSGEPPERHDFPSKTFACDSGSG